MSDNKNDAADLAFKIVHEVRDCFLGTKDDGNKRSLYDVGLDMKHCPNCEKRRRSADAAEDAGVDAYVMYLQGKDRDGGGGKKKKKKKKHKKSKYLRFD